MMKGTGEKVKRGIGANCGWGKSLKKMRRDMEEGRNEPWLTPLFGGGGEVGHFDYVGIGGGFAFGDVRGGDGSAGLFAEPLVEFAFADVDGSKRGGGAFFCGHQSKLLGGRRFLHG